MNNMLETLEEKIESLKEKARLNKWYYFIPLIGTIIYIRTFITFLKQKTWLGNKIQKIIKRYLLFFLIPVLIIILTLIGVFFYLDRVTENSIYWTLTWAGTFSFIGAIYLFPFPIWLLYTKSIKKYEATQDIYRS